MAGCRGLTGILSPETKTLAKQVQDEAQTVSSFLDALFSTSYRSDPDWQVSGQLLISLGSWGEGQYHYFINGQYVHDAIGNCPFDPNTDRLDIEKMINGSWQRIWSWPRRRATHYLPQQAEPQR